MKILKKSFYLLLLFFTGIANVYSQADCLKALEDKIGAGCFNCNQAKMNLYLNKECIKIDSVIQKLSVSFEKSLDKKYAKDRDMRSKKKMVSMYSHTVSDLKKIRSRTIKDYAAFLDSDSTENDYFGSLFYLYWSNRTAEMIAYYIDTIEEN